MQRYPIPSRLALGAIAVTLAACATASTQETTSTTPADAAQAEVGPQVPKPELNPHPKHIVKIHGKLPRGFDIDLDVSYETTSNTPECNQSFNIGGFGGAKPLMFFYTQEVKKLPGRFEANFVVDKYLPGKCGWKLRGIAGSVTTDEKGLDESPSDSIGMVLLGRLLDAPPNAPGCQYPPNPDGTGCQEERFWRMFNDDERAPVLVPCRSETYTPFATNLKKRAFTCGRPWVYKSGHVLRENTRKVTINVYDLNHEPDPSPDPGPAIPPRKEH